MSSSTNWDKELIDFLLLDLPEPVQRKHGFMDIAGVQYHENTITRIYSYFLDRNRSPEISNIFLESIIDLVTIKLKQSERFEFDNLGCLVEYQTKKGNRIDLVVISTSVEDSGRQTHKTALIIENKIFSGVKNDLHDYFDSVNAERKTGILLTLKPYEIPLELQAKFINITHSDWMQQIKSKGLPTNLSINDYVYLNDFIDNMENLSENNEINNDAKFFFEHPSKVLRAQKTYEAAFKYIIDQLNISADKLGWEFYGNSWNWRHIWDSKNQSQVYFAIVFNKSVSEKPEITIYLEIYKDALKREVELRQILNENGIYVHLNDDKTSNSSWARLAFKTYKLTLKEIEALSDYLYSKIQEDFIPAYLLISNNINSIAPKI